jgi:hypothetical protein
MLVRTYEKLYRLEDVDWENDNAIELKEENLLLDNCLSMSPDLKKAILFFDNKYDNLPTQLFIVDVPTEKGALMLAGSKKNKKPKDLKVDLNTTMQNVSEQK